MNQLMTILACSLLLAAQVAAQRRDFYTQLFRAPSQGYEGSALVWGGGPLQSNVEVTLVFFGNTRYQAKTTAFYSGILKSGYFDWLSEYNVYRGHFIQTIKADVGKVVSPDPSDVAISVIQSHNLTINPNTYIAIHYGPEYDKALGACCESCAYHIPLTYNNVILSVGMIPDCSSRCYDKDPFSSMTCVASHELVESVTDPGNGGWTLATDSNLEIGDICYDQCGKLVDDNGDAHEVQYLWSNHAGQGHKGMGCIITDPSRTLLSEGKEQKQKNLKTKTYKQKPTRKTKAKKPNKTSA